MGMAHYSTPRTPAIFEGASATFYIIIACVVVYFAQVFLPRFTVEWFSLIPGRVIFRGQVWRLFSYLFLHGNFTHLFFNMLGLFFFGPVLERTLGYRRFWTLYLLSGVGAGAVATGFYFAFHDADAHIIGASGAIFGILAAYGLLYPNTTVYMNFILPIKAKWLVIIYGALELLSTIQYAAGARSGIASIAHVSGIIFALFYIRGGRLGPRKLWFRYKYWRAERELKKFQVVRGDKDQTIH